MVQFDALAKRSSSSGSTPSANLPGPVADTYEVMQAVQPCLVRLALD